MAAYFQLQAQKEVRQRMDRISRERRSANMGRIKGKNTSPELAVRRCIHRLGYRFTLHRKDLPGKPDLVLPRHRLIIFVHGCFWHRHHSCRFAYMPKSRVDFWQDKFSKNVLHDRKVQRALKAGGWRVAVIWECQTEDPAKLRHHIQKLLRVLRQLPEPQT